VKIVHQSKKVASQTQQDNLRDDQFLSTLFTQHVSQILNVFLITLRGETPLTAY